MKKYIIEPLKLGVPTGIKILIGYEVKEFIEMIAYVTNAWGKKTYHINGMSFTIKSLTDDV